MEEIVKLLYPSPLLSEIAALGESEINRRFERIKALIRARLDGSPVPELAGVQAQVKLVQELHNTVLEQARSYGHEPERT
jgi:hypothetical protein